MDSCVVCVVMRHFRELCRWVFLSCMTSSCRSAASLVFRIDLSSRSLRRTFRLHIVTVDSRMVAMWLDHLRETRTLRVIHSCTSWNHHHLERHGRLFFLKNKTLWSSHWNLAASWVLHTLGSYASVPTIHLLHLGGHRSLARTVSTRLAALPDLRFGIPGHHGRNIGHTQLLARASKAPSLVLRRGARWIP